MKNIKRIMSLLLVIVLLITATPSIVFATAKYGYTYDTSVYKVSWKTMESFKVYSDAGKVIGTCSHVVGLTREKGTNNYVLMTREVMSPNNSRVLKSGSTYGYGFSEYVSAKVTLPSLDDYEPQNTPYSDTIEFSIGVDSDGASIGASYSISHSDLDITASCSTPDKLYHIKYNYKPSIANPLANNKYLANESVQLGAASFHKNSKNVSFTMNYDARFGMAEDNAASPWLIYLNYVKKATKSRTYSFTITKN